MRSRQVVRTKKPPAIQEFFADLKAFRDFCYCAINVDRPEISNRE
jgi:hypothetical protein